MLLFERILIWQRLADVQTGAERLDFFYSWFQRSLSSAGVFDIIHKSIRLVAWCDVKEGKAHYRQRKVDIYYKKDPS